jgi:hypothetical protein
LAGVTLLAGVALLAGCESSTSSPARATPSPVFTSSIKIACNLITKEQAEATAGVSFTAQPAELRQPHGAQCLYNAPKGQVSVQLDDSAGIDSGRVAFSSPNAEPVPGVGDEAIWNPALYVLWIRKGDKALTVQVVNLGLAKDTVKNNAINLAGQILPNI